MPRSLCVCRSVLLALVLLLAAAPCLRAAGADEANGVNIAAARGVLRRLLPRLHDQVDLAALPVHDGRERFRISAQAGRVRIEGNTTSALLFGANWYLKYAAKVQISTDGIRLGDMRKLPLPQETIE